MHFSGSFAAVAGLFVAVTVTVAVPRPSLSAIDAPSTIHSVNATVDVDTTNPQSHLSNRSIQYDGNKPVAINNSTDVALIPRNSNNDDPLKNILPPQDPKEDPFDDLLPHRKPYDPELDPSNPHSLLGMRIRCRQELLDNRWLYEIQVYNSAIHNEDRYDCGEVFREKMHHRCSVSFMGDFQCLINRNQTGIYMSFTVNLFCRASDVQLTLLRVFGLQAYCPLVEEKPKPDPYPAWRLPPLSERALANATLDGVREY